MPVTGVCAKKTTDRHTMSPMDLKSNLLDSADEVSIHRQAADQSFLCKPGSDPGRYRRGPSGAETGRYNKPSRNDVAA